MLTMLCAIVIIIFVVIQLKLTSAAEKSLSGDDGVVDKKRNKDERRKTLS